MSRHKFWQDIIKNMMENNTNDQNAQGANDRENQNQTNNQDTGSQEVSASNEGIGEHSVQTPADAVNSDEPERSTDGSEGGGGWNNNKPGATNEEKDGNLIPPVDPENYTS